MPPCARPQAGAGLRRAAAVQRLDRIAAVFAQERVGGGGREAVSSARGHTGGAEGCRSRIEKRIA